MYFGAKYIQYLVYTKFKTRLFDTLEQDFAFINLFSSRHDAHFESRWFSVHAISKLDSLKRVGTVCWKPIRRSGPEITRRMLETPPDRENTIRAFSDQNTVAATFRVWSLYQVDSSIPGMVILALELLSGQCRRDRLLRTIRVQDLCSLIKIVLFFRSFSLNLLRMLVLLVCVYFTLLTFCSGQLARSLECTAYLQAIAEQEYW